MRAKRAFQVSLLTLCLSVLVGTLLGPMTAAANPPTGGDLVPLAPTRIANTVNGTGGLGSSRFSPGETRALIVTGLGGVPASGVSAVLLQVTASNSTSAGSLTLYRDDVSLPPTTAVSFPSVQSASAF